MIKKNVIVENNYLLHNHTEIKITLKETVIK